MKHLLLSGVLLLCGCNHVVHGHVVAKSIQPPEMILMPVLTSCGKSSCLTYLPVFFPESYEVVVTGPNEKGNKDNETLWVDRAEFDHMHVGDVYECGGARHKKCQNERLEK